MHDVKAKAVPGNPEKREGEVPTATRDHKAVIPSDIIFWATVGFMAVSLGYKLFRKGSTSRFLDQWTPAAVLLFGIYNKLANQSGHSTKS